MGKPISEDGRIIQGKYEGYFVYLWKLNVRRLTQGKVNNYQLLI